MQRHADVQEYDVERRGRDCIACLRSIRALAHDQHIIVPFETVDYIQADDVYAVVHAAEKRYLVRTALEALEHDLDPAQFIRVHRSYIVRANRIREVRRAGAMVVVLETGAEIPVSRRRRAALDAVLKPLAR